ncbi:MAG TPA: matrixin family metalloprotease [Thermoanaerobaculia bacterium]|nr:matrixin family metalloprotease [Thermoanaerobaculia bacterium]
MNRIHPLALPCALAAAGLFLAGHLAAYSLFSLNRTWSCPPDYTVDNAGLASVSDGNGGVVQIVAAINSTNAWNGGTSGKVVRAHAGSTAGFAVGDGIPMIKLSDPFGVCTGSCLAVTFVGSYSERATGSGSWEIDDADVVTNSTGHNWTSVAEDPFNIGCSAEFFAEGVMVHEVGHGLGLGHSTVSGATMSSTLGGYCNGNWITTEADDENGLAALYGTAPCTGCLNFTNYLAEGYGNDHGDCGTYYQATSGGTHSGYLRGPAGTDFDLALWRWTNGSWALVTFSAGSSSSENISYNGTAGWYYWEVTAHSGSGTYHFWLNRP